MKAYYVQYDTPGTSGFSDIVLVKKEEEIETALAAKSTRRFEVGDPYSKITYKEEIPLSKVKLSDLSIIEFLMMKT